MPFGLKNAAQTFQRLKDRVTQDLEGVFVYLDDILIASKIPQEHPAHLTALFQTLRNYGLVVHPKKCAFGQEQLEFLGHVVSAQGIQPLRSSVRAVLHFGKPKSIKGLQRFLGMVNFYHRFIKNAAWIVLSLTCALRGKPKSLTWTRNMCQAFDLAKRALA